MDIILQSDGHFHSGRVISNEEVTFIYFFDKTVYVCFNVVVEEKVPNKAICFSSLI